LFDFVEGLKVLCPQYGPRLAVLVADHPAFKRPDAILPPDPLRAEGFYGRGLRLYFEGRYGAAEKEFLQAVRFHNQDARYLYFLGLSRLGLGQLELALEDFRLGARLEVLEKPARGAVSFSLERVQGPHRRLLNGFRDRAEREAVGVGP
jgi:tetratricopeptide (TPR) repeat protein